MKAILFPGQGIQFRGMGSDLFPEYREIVDSASELLGYSIEKLCLEDPDRNLHRTQYTQPAIYVVNALRYFKTRDEAPANFEVNYALGHSLGEYNALLVGGAFDFETGLKLVLKRGELMGAASGGSMAAIIGESEDVVRKLLHNHHLDSVDLVNFNTPSQFVVSGPCQAITETELVCTQNGIKCFQLNVTGPFHSRYMKNTQALFADFLEGFTIDDPKIPVIANSTAMPYALGTAASTLANQIGSPVLWSESIRYLIRQGDSNIEFLDMSNGFLNKMIKEIRNTYTSIIA